MNPLDARVVFVENQSKEFFNIVLGLHRHLLLGEKIGKPLVGASVLIFLLLSISGIVLWWPKKWNKRNLKQALTIKWISKFKRTNYDLHNVLGFYCLVPGLILAMTGLVYSYNWFDKAMSYTFSGGQERTAHQIPTSVGTARESSTLDISFSDVLKKYPTADMISIRFRKDEDTPHDFQIRKQKGRTYHFSWDYYDRASGTLLYSYGNADLNRADKIRAMNFDLHVGSFLGFPTKILAFISSLICASLPLTGFLIWYNKGRKRRF